MPVTSTPSGVSGRFPGSRNGSSDTSRRSADLIVCTSETVQAEVVQRFRVPAGRTRVQPNGIDVLEFPLPGLREVEEARRELGLSPGDVVLMNVGRLDVQKGQDLLLRALAPIAASRPDLKLVLVGSVPSPNRTRMGAYAGELRELARSHGMEEQVTFTGWREDVPRLLGAPDLYVHPSRWEGPALCLSVLEAMAASLPVISTDCSGRPRGFVDGEHGWVVPTGEVDALGEALSRALSTSADELRRIGARGRTLAERPYDIRRVGERFVELVEGTVSR